jgi:hypothetical protein
VDLDSLYNYAANCYAQQVTLERVLEEWLGHVNGVLSPLQRAVCRVADGRPLAELAQHEHVQLALGGGVPPQAMPKRLELLAGIRTGKSLMAAGLAYCASQRVDLTALGPGEVPRVSVVSVAMDLAEVIFAHLVGNMRATRSQASRIVGEPTTTSVMIMHPSGRPVEVKIVAGARAGSTLVARWSAGCIFDESPRMVGADVGAVVNLDDMIAAVLGRLLPGAQVVDIGSPWAPYGPAFECQKEHWGKPTRNVVVIRARADHLNPHHWTPEKVLEIRETNERVYRTDVLGEFADVEASMFDSERLAKCSRAELVIQPDPLQYYVAVMDPATRANAWTLVIGTQGDREDGATFLRVVLAKQWQGSVDSPLDPDTILQDVRAVIEPYGCNRVISDQYAADALIALGRRHDLVIEEQTVTGPSKQQSFGSLSTMVDVGGVELPDDPILLGDLKRVQRVITRSGISIHLPQTADGRHCDYAAALAMLAVQPLRKPDEGRRALPVGWDQADVDELAKSVAKARRDENGGRKPRERFRSGRGGGWRG